MPLDFSVGAGAKSTRARTITADNFAAFARMVEFGQYDDHQLGWPPAPRGSGEAFKRAKENLPWLACPFKNDRRNGANALPWPVMLLDIDRCAPALKADMLAFFQSAAPMIAHTTASSTPDAPRLRLMLELSRPATAAECKALAQALVARMLAAHPNWKGLVVVDGAQQNAGQIAFQPCQEAEWFALQATAERPAPLDVDALLAADAPATAPTPATEGASASATDWADRVRPHTASAVNEVKQALAFLDPAAQDSGDHERAAWLDCLMALKSLVAPPHNWPEHGYADARGVEVEGVRDLALEWSSRGAKFDEAEFQKAWSSLAPVRKDGTSIRLETLFKKAYAAGWNPNAGAGEGCPRDGTDEGYCCRFIAFVDGKIMFCNSQWYNWTGVFWRPDAGGVWARMKAFALHHVARANEAFAKAVEQAQSARNDRDAKAILIAAKLALRAAEGILEQPRQKRVLEAAQTPCRIDADRLDADPMLLCVQNGIVSLETGELSEPDPSALMTKVAACAYDPDARAPRFEKFMAEVQPDAGMRQYLQRWAGYALTGGMEEQVMAIWTGAGSNGKSLLQPLLASAMGSYANTSEAKLLVGREKREESAEPGLAKLRGLRFTYANESDEHSKLSSARLNNHRLKPVG